MGAPGWVILTDDYPPGVGGVATWSHWASEALRSCGTVRVYARHRSGLVDAEGVRGRSFGRRGGRHLALAARRDLRSAGGVLATTWPMATWAIHMVPRGTPVHVVFHGSDVTAGPPRKALRRVASRARCWAVSAYLARWVRRFGIDAGVLPIPISDGPAAVDGQRWVCVTRAIRGKGGDRFVRLCAEAGRAGDLVGDGPERSRWQALATRLGASVRFHGALPREGVERVLDDAALAFLLPAERADGAAEGLGLTLLEAARRGIPTVGTGVGGVPEVCGLVLTEPDDAAASVARIQDWTPADPRSVLDSHGPVAFLERLRSGTPP